MSDISLNSIAAAEWGVAGDFSWVVAVVELDGKPLWGWALGEIGFGLAILMFVGDCQAGLWRVAESLTRRGKVGSAGRIAVGCRLWVVRKRHFGWDRGVVRRGSAPSGLVAVGVPAASSLSRIFVRIGNGLDGPSYTIPDSMPGSLDCAARGLQPPGHSVDTIHIVDAAGR